MAPDNLPPLAAGAVTPLDNAAIFNDDIPPVIFRSYSRLLSIAWRHNYERTDPLDFERELVPLLGVSRAAVYNHLRILKAGRFIDWTTNGDRQITITFIHESRSLDSETPAPEAEVQESRSLDSKTLRGGRSLINLNLKKIPPPLKPPESRNLDSETPPSVERILEATRVLFGRSLFKNRITLSQEPLYLLAIIADRYQQGYDRIGAVYNAIKNYEAPPDHILADPLAYLPRNFLEAAGLVEPADPASEPESPPPEDPAPELDAPLLASGLSPQEAWSAALERLPQTIPKPDFDTWIQTGRLAGYRDGAFDLRFHNAAALRVAGRYADQIAQALTAAAGHPVSLNLST